MGKLGFIIIMMGVILSFHDTLWGWAGLFAIAWALLASVEYHLKKMGAWKQ